MEQPTPTPIQRPTEVLDRLVIIEQWAAQAGLWAGTHLRGDYVPDDGRESIYGE